MHGFSANFQDMFSQEDLELIMFFGGYLATDVAMAMLLIIFSLKFLN